MYRILTLVAVLAIIASSAAGTFLAGTGTALAPEPVYLTEPLGSTQGSAGAAVYVNSGYKAGDVVNWPGSYTPGSWAAGNPCSTTGLPAGAQTAQVIVAYGNYRKCV